MVAKEIDRRSSREATPGRAWVVGIIAWLVPGAGHVMTGRWLRAVLLGGAVWAMFITGLMLGGHLFTVSSNDQGFSALLQLLPMIANIGTGALYIVCWLMNVGFTEHAQRLTYEYGNTFLLVAGLLNYLAMLDAFDIAAGRKE